MSKPTQLIHETAACSERTECDWKLLFRRIHLGALMWLLRIGLIAAVTSGCVSGDQRQDSSATESEETPRFDFRVKKYDQFYEIAPDRKIFRSNQKVVLFNTAEEVAHAVTFSLHPDLAVDMVSVTNVDGQTISIGPIHRIASKKWSDHNETAFPVFKLPIQAVSPGHEVSFELRYHLKAEAVRDKPSAMYALTVSPMATYAVGPVTGNNPIFGRNIAAPFKILIKHPRDLVTCCPGELVSSSEEAGTVIDTYACDYPNIPTFSCARYRKVQRESGESRLEFYSYARQGFRPEMADDAFDVLRLYHRTFGENGTSNYRFGIVGGENTLAFGGENKGNAIYMTDFIPRLQTNFLLRNFAKFFTGGLSGELTYSAFIYHELFHNWNLFYLHWSGKLYEWFGEGGANFIAAWALEKMHGERAGALMRKSLMKQFIKIGGYNATSTLETAKKAGSVERSLMYHYGALVWEQLRRKLGEDRLMAALRGFFEIYAFKDATYGDFLECLKSSTGEEVDDFLDQWVKRNAKIEIRIDTVSTERRAGSYETLLTILVDSDSDYELFTSVGYVTHGESELHTMPIQLHGKGRHTVFLETVERPTRIEIDPSFSVPRMNLKGTIWKS